MIKVPIEISIKDLKKYNLVALVVDREDFLSDLEMIRTKLNVSEVPYKFPKSQYDEVNKDITFYNQGKFTIYDIYESLREFCQTKHIYLSDIDKTLATAVVWAEALSRKYRKSNLYLPVFLSAILVGKVDEFVLRATYIETLDKNRLLQIHDELDEDEQLVTIRVSRESSQKEVLETFDFIQKYVFGERKSKDTDILEIYKNQLPKHKLPNTISRIVRDRNWYFLRREGKTIAEICELFPKDSENYYSEKTIDGAINQYQKRLNIPLEYFS